MGMSDTLRLFGADAARARCAAGHPADGELQTKAFDCELDHYYVFEGQLYACRRANEPEEALVPSMEGENLVLSRRVTLSTVHVTIDAAAYTHCERCDPVVFEREAFERVDHRHVWCEWNLFFERGRLTRVDPARLETRESLRQQMLHDGVGVLPDDDRIAKKHLRQLREGRRPSPW
jgi:hypothetical protein